MRKWNLPITYEPKIQPVIAGTCRQTIRAVKEGSWKKEVGDLIRFYTWAGKPYHSKRTTITEYVPLIEVLSVKIFVAGLEFPPFSSDKFSDDNFVVWHDLNDLAIRDGIVPPKGVVLRNVILSKNKIPIGGQEAQILRW